jgi:hypothetical protein
MLPMFVCLLWENFLVGVENFDLGISEGCLDKTTNEYWTEVAIPHVLSSKE